MQSPDLSAEIIPRPIVDIPGPLSSKDIRIGVSVQPVPENHPDLPENHGLLEPRLETRYVYESIPEGTLETMIMIAAGKCAEGVRKTIELQRQQNVIPGKYLPVM